MDSIERKRRTRTLIQMGGLMETAGIMDTFHLTPGDDLQEDAFDQAATLLGALMDLRDSPPQQHTLWMQRGKERLGKGEA